MTDGHVLVSDAVGNLRDVGGRPTSDGGTVARGVAYRSAELASPAVAEDPELARLAIRTVVDLRTASERGQRPDVVPPGARHVVLDVLADLPPQAAGQIPAILADPSAAARTLDGLDIAGAMVATYRELVVSTSARAAYAAFVRLVIDPDATPLLFHCTAGKDRTGWAATILLLAAGVDDDGVRAEFLGVNPAVRTTFAPLLHRLEAAGVDPGLLAPALEVRPEYLETALATVRDEHGSFDAYLTDGLGLSTLEVEALRHTMRA
ncbi:tyrosine-protein phosphatase [Cellulomonas sp. DKR-3]|uniref:Tyrosine-protein phosphatase n=1 Tax=Cellulomonas fulva TaxID=2835530 RepID=A0ABS5TXK6_9CELL|nr:tyrosine-protein phosphatase [Cellulomonas fulva]MBT0993880.1 tyrosine-protein phosphatase [Cellulomonas fulva]